MSRELTPANASWWVGLDRADFAREIATRIEFWRTQQPKGILDSVGERMRESWEPPRPMSTVRKPL